MKMILERGDKASYRVYGMQGGDAWERNLGGRAAWAGRQMESGCRGRGRSLGRSQVCCSGDRVTLFIEIRSTREGAGVQRSGEMSLIRLPRDVSVVSCMWGPGEQGRAPGWRQRLENHLWRHREEADKTFQDGQIELETGPVATDIGRKPWGF